MFDFLAFKDRINSKENLIYVQGAVNNVKGTIIGADNNRHSLSKHEAVCNLHVAPISSPFTLISSFIEEVAHY
jgi:hypothetical protein